MFFTEGQPRGHAPMFSPGAKLQVFIVMLGMHLLLSGVPALAQSNDTANKITIHILSSKNGYYFNTDSGAYNKFVDSVIFMEGSDTLFCDSAVQNSTSKNFEAFGDVRIAQKDGTQATSDYLRYTAAQKLAYMRGNVHLNDGKNELECAELTYDVGNKTGTYTNGGTLHNDSTTVTSHSGVYNVNSKDARFTGRVVIVDPQYKIRSEDLVYNTDSKLTKFYAKSTITSDSGRSILQTKSGTYDGKNGIAHFVGHSTIWDDGHYIEGDSLYYNKAAGYGLGIGHVVSIDTAHHSTLYCGRAEYFQKKKILWALIKPVLEQVNGKDTFYMRADTIYSAPMVRFQASAPKAVKQKKGIDTAARKLNGQSTSKPDSADAIPFFADRDSSATDSMFMTISSFKSQDTITVRPNFIGPLPDGHSFVGLTKAGGAMPIADTAKIRADTLERLSLTNRRGDTAKSIAGKRKRTTKDSTEVIYWVVPADKFRINTALSIAPTAVASDSTPAAKKRTAKPRSKIAIDTASADTTAPQFFLGYNHVLIFSDSMQGKCDSICYTRSDSTVRMIYNPIVWSHKSQITGDTILLELDSSGIRSMYVPNNAFVVSQTGPDKARIYDQVQGRTLTAYFKDNAIDSMLVFPEAESIYYSKDDHGAYLGVNQANSVLMRIFFNDQKIKKIKFEKDVHQTMTPLDKADLPNTRLGRFRWLIDQRPMSKEELFR